MARNQVTIAADPADVFRVLDDADAYPRWVVGTRRIRRVDPDWPREGSEFHHAVGVAGAELHDSSEIIDRDPPHHLQLEVRFRPSGVACVDLEVKAADGGSCVTMHEEVREGPVAWLPTFLTDPLLSVRNAWSLRRLRTEVERRHRPGP